MALFFISACSDHAENQEVPDAAIPETLDAAIPETTPDASRLPAGQARVNSTGGTALSTDNMLTFTVPAGALSVELTIAIGSFKNAPAGVIGSAYDIGPSGTTFSKPVTLTFRYDPAWLQGISASDLKVATVDKGIWQVLPGSVVNEAQKTVSATTTHLSVYGLVAPPNPCKNQKDGTICGTTGKICVGGSCVAGCHIDFCLFGGKCSVNSAKDGITCECPSGFSGLRCETRVATCEPNPCQNSGRCTVSNRSFQCDCGQNFIGPRCETPVRSCDPNPCQHGGICDPSLRDSRHPRCHCPKGYTGTWCETPSCKEGLCLNGGTCSQGSAEYTCSCAAGYSGKNCEISWCKATVIDFRSYATSSTPSLSEAGVTVTGSAKLNLLKLSGLGVVGGYADYTVDGTEWVEFKFAGPAVNVRYNNSYWVNHSGGDGKIEAWDANGASMGILSNSRDVSAAYMWRPISRFRYTASGNGINFTTLNFDICQ